MPDMFFQGWGGILRTVIASVLTYASLILFLRVSGKRTLAKLNAFDLVVTVALGSTFAAIILQKSVALAEGLTALALLVGMQLLVTFVSVRSARFARLIRSEPTLLVHNGEPCPRAMHAERITEDEALSAVRASGGRSLADAGAVILESDGTLSVSLRGDG